MMKPRLLPLLLLISCFEAFAPLKALDLAELCKRACEAIAVRQLREFKESIRPILSEPSPFLAALDRMNIKIKIIDRSRNSLLTDRPLIFVGNHPFGILDAVIAVTVGQTFRPDARVVGASTFRLLVDGFPNVANRMILIDRSTKANPLKLKGSIDLMIKELKAGHSIWMMPSGQVSTWDFHINRPMDPPWNRTAIEIARKSNALLVPVQVVGRNSFAYYAAYKMFSPLRRLFLVNEFKNKFGSTVPVIIGKVVDPDTLNKDSEIAARDMQQISENLHLVP